MCSGWLIGSCVTKAQGWGGWLFVLCDGSRIGLFSRFLQAPFDKSSQIYIYIYLPEFLKTGLVKIRAHFTTWQLKAIKSVQRPIKKPVSDAEQ